MIAVDTNVNVRLLVADDPVQGMLAAKLFESEQIFISETVLLETVWVLSYSYELTAVDIADAIRRFLGLPNVHLRDASAVARALEWYAFGLDFADALHLALGSDCDQLATFDRRFVARARPLNAPPVVLLG